MGEKTVKKLPMRLDSLAKGLFYVLFSLILALNVGKVARTLVFPLIYLFGTTTYLILAYVAIRGLYRIIMGKPLKIKSIIIHLGIIFLFLAYFFIVPYYIFATNSINGITDPGHTFSFGVQYNLYNFNLGLKNYYQPGFLNIFDPASYWTNGVIGLSICSLIGNDQLIITLGYLFLCVSFIFFMIKPSIFLIKLVRRHHEVEEGKKRALQAAKEEIREEQQEIKPIYVPEPEPKEENLEVPYGYEVEEEAESFNDFSSLNMSLDDNFASRKYPDDQYNEFTKLSFREKVEPSFSMVKEEIPPQTVNSFAPIEEEREIENEEMEIPPFDDSYIEEDVVSIRPNPVPVMNEEKPKIDEGLIRQQPVFEEPKPIVNPMFDHPTPAPVVEEKVEEKKKKERVVWIPPSSELLEVYETSAAIEANSKAAEGRLEAINTVLANFSIGARCTSYTIGSSVTRFNIEYDSNVSMKSVEKLVDDISLRLGGVNARFTKIVQGQAYSGLEIPNVQITTVSFKEVFESLPDVKKHPLAVGFGKDISGNVVAADFDEFPHLLVAGTTGSGKSIYIHSIIATLIMRVSPDDLKIVLVDPKKVEMTKYRDMPHLLCPIITEAEKAKVMLSKLVDEMNDRYARFADAESCSNIKQYNEWAKENNAELMPYIIVILDEYADLIDTCKEISQPVVSIAQKARAAGIHMLISTQRPSTNVITGVIKGNLPTHVALMTSSYTDSMTIVGEGGAEKLLGKGDMLVQSPLVSRVGLTRLQGCFVQNKEIGRIVGYLKEHYETVYDENYMDLIDHSKEVANNKIALGEVEKEADAAEEAKYQSIKEWVMTQQFVSMSKIQRECQVGFNRAGRFFNRLQKEGVVSTEQDGATKGCKVLVHDDFDYDSGVSSEELTRY